MVTDAENGTTEELVAANRAPLDWLNFLLGNVKDGLGPFLAIFLMSNQHWDAGSIGIVLTTTAPAFVAANQQATMAGLLAERISTRLPGLTP